MNYNEVMNAYKTALNMVESAGITTTGLNKNNIYSMNRMSCYGLCHSKKLGNGVNSIIKLDKNFMKNGKEEDVICTLVHEILHHSSNCTDWGCKHKGKWKEYADIMNRKYGMNISRCSYHTDENGEAVLKEKPVKAILECTVCNHQYKYYRVSKYVKEYKNCRCCCGGKLERTL